MKAVFLMRASCMQFQPIGLYSAAAIPDTTLNKAAALQSFTI
jgi:hypothetical protein